MRNWPSQGPPGSSKNTIVFMMKIKIVYFLKFKKANSPRSYIGPVPAGIRACLLFFLQVPESGDPEARVSWGPPAEKHSQRTVKFLGNSAPWPPRRLTARRPGGGSEDKLGGCPAQSPMRGVLHGLAFRKDTCLETRLAGLVTWPGGGRGRGRSRRCLHSGCRVRAPLSRSKTAARRDKLLSCARMAPGSCFCISLSAPLTPFSLSSFL